MPLSYNISTSNADGRMEQLHINLTKKAVKASLIAISFLDKDTKQYVIYMPSLELSGYGDTKAEAKQMIDATIQDCFSYFFTLSLGKLHEELRKYGWTKGMFSKEFSHVFVDTNGNLENYNAEDIKIEKFSLSAA